MRQEIKQNQDDTETVSSSLDEYPLLLVVDRDRSIASQLAIDANWEDPKTQRESQSPIDRSRPHRTASPFPLLKKPHSP